MKTTGLLVAALCFGACATPNGSAAPAPNNAQVARQRYVAAYNAAVAAVERYSKAPEPETDDSRLAEAKIAELENELSALNGLGGSLASVERETRGRHTGLAFALGDAAIAKGSLNLADRVYRRLVEFYVGSAYTGIRDRARLGIDDVRAKRAAAPAR